MTSKRLFVNSSAYKKIRLLFIIVLLLTNINLLFANQDSSNNSATKIIAQSLKKSEELDLKKSLRNYEELKRNIFENSKKLSPALPELNIAETITLIHGALEQGGIPDKLMSDYFSKFKNTKFKIKKGKRKSKIKNKKHPIGDPDGVATYSLFTQFSDWITNLDEITNLSEKITNINTGNKEVIEIIDLISNKCPKLSYVNTTSYQEYFDKQLQKLCYRLFFFNMERMLPSIITNERSSESIITIFNEFLKTHIKNINQNNSFSSMLHHFLEQIQFYEQSKMGTTKVSYLLFYQKISELISKLIVEYKIIPHQAILQKIIITTELTSFVQNIDFNKSNLRKMLQNELKDLANFAIQPIKNNWQVEINEKQINEKFSEMLNFYQLNKFELKTPQTHALLILMGKMLLNRKFYDSSEKYFRLALEIVPDEKSYYDDNFYIIFGKIIQGHYLQTSEFINNQKLHENLSKLPPKLLFWMGFTMIKLEKLQLAQTYFQNIIDLYPISYYAIMASKLLKSTSLQSISSPITNKENPTSLGNSLNNYNDHQIFKNFKDSSLYDVLLKRIVENSDGPLNNILRRLQIWIELNFIPFINFEFYEAITYFNKSNSTANLDDIKLNSQKNCIKSFIGTIFAIILQQNNMTLQSFSLINNSLDVKNCKIDLNQLFTLFPNEHYKFINQYSKKIDPFIILSLIKQESAFNVNAVSSAGARGLMQLLPSTAKLLKHNVTKKQLNDPETNIKLGSLLLNKLAAQLDGNLSFILMSYNAGERNTEKWNDHVFKDLKDFSQLKINELIPFNETQNYVQVIERNLFFYKFLYDPSKRDSSSHEEIFDINLTNILQRIDQKNSGTNSDLGEIERLSLPLRNDH